MKKVIIKPSPITGIFAVLIVGAAFGLGSVGAALLLEGTPAVEVAAAFPPEIALNPNRLVAASAILYDPKDGRILFSKDAYSQRPLASLTKLMTAEVVLSSTTPNTYVTITTEDLKPDGDFGFRVGDSVSVRDLLKLGLVASSNDAIAAAAGSVPGDYLARMNQTAKDLGLTESVFKNPTGLDISTNEAGAVGSAYDVARLAAVFYKNHPDYFELTSRSGVSIQSGGSTLTGAATMASLQNIPGFVAAKTGYTDLAGGNLVMVFDIDIGHPLVGVVLGSTEDDRFSDMRTIISSVRDAIHTK